MSYTRIKRSLIPIIGKDLSYLFNTATNADLNTMLKCCRLAKVQGKIAHVVDKNTSVINITAIEMSENRQVLNKIIGSLANLDAKLGNITQALEEEVFQVGQFVQLILQLDSFIQAIMEQIGKQILMRSIYSYNSTCFHWDTFHHQSLPQEV